MRIVTAETLAGLFTFPELIEQLRHAFRQGVVTPVRHHHTVTLAGEPAATLLLMPAWTDMAAQAPSETYVGVKIVAVYPGNKARGKPSVAGSYLLMAGGTGEPLAVLDGSALTLWRTAAASALAASFLARKDSSRMLMVGAGALAPFLIAAHSSIRSIQEVAIWNRNPEAAERLAADLARQGCPARPCTDLEAEVRSADIISCATLSSDPIVRGAWLKAGAHLDLVGAFTPAMRESDDEAVRRARVFVDTRAGACTEGGDIVQPLRAGILAEADICGDLFDLCRGASAGRASDEEITLFKSVGTALEDLTAAALAYAKLTGEPAQPDGP